MKIVQLISAYQLGGAEKVAFDIANKLNDEKINIEFISIFKVENDFSKVFKKNLNSKGIKWKEVALTKQSSKFKYLSLLYSTFFLFFYFLKNKIHIVHSHTDLPDFVLSNVLKLYSIFGITRLNVIRTIHNTELWPTHFILGKFVEKSFCNDSVVFISEDVKKAYKNIRKKYILSESKKQYFISNGVDLDLFTRKKNISILETLHINLDKNKINLLFVGRFVHQKGFDILINVFKNLPSELENKFQIYSFGSGELAHLVDNSIPMRILNPINNIYEVYSFFDYLIMPSRHEGLPLVSLEASASKLPIIASYSPGLKETLPNNWDLYFNNESLEELENILIKISNNYFNPVELSKKSFAFVEKNFNLNTTISKYKDLYQRVQNEKN